MYISFFGEFEDYYSPEAAILRAAQEKLEKEIRDKYWYSDPDKGMTFDEYQYATHAHVGKIADVPGAEKVFESPFGFGMAGGYLNAVGVKLGDAVLCVVWVPYESSQYPGWQSWGVAKWPIQFTGGVAAPVNTEIGADASVNENDEGNYQ